MTQVHLLAFEGPDAYSRAGGIATRVVGLADALAERGLDTHLWFVGDRRCPGVEQRGRLTLHRWCQWISSYAPLGVYQDEEGKERDFRVPVTGSFLGLTLGAVLYVSATTALGLLISTFTSTQVAALFAAGILTMVPTVSFSGLTNPVAALEGPGAVAGRLFPASYFITLCRGAFDKGLGFRELLPQLLSIAAFAPVFVLITVALLRKQGR